MTRPTNPASALGTALRSTSLDVLRTGGACDAVVVGAGAAGGLAALALTEAGLRVLVLDAGWPAQHHRSLFRRATVGLVQRLADPEGLRFIPPRFVPRVRSTISAVGRWRQPVQSTNYAWAFAPSAFVDDRDCPYATEEGAPFAWIRARQLGGRMTIPMHGRLYFRFGPDDLRPTDGLTPPWPVDSGELDDWYGRVERRLGLLGSYDRVPWLPDSELATELAPSVDQAELQARLAARWPFARPVLGRHAPPPDYLEAAARTGRLLCRQGAVVNGVEVDAAGCVSGVTWIDEAARSAQRVHAPLVFLCASTLESTRILLLSKSADSPTGLGDGSGFLGRHLMDHLLVKAEGEAPPLVEPPAAVVPGHCVFLPRFDARHSPAPAPGRGFGVQLHQYAGGMGRSYFVMTSFGEMLPQMENRVTLDPTRRDAWGIPTLRIECRHSAADIRLANMQAESLRDLAAALDVTISQWTRIPDEPGASIHECGTARMGTEPSNSVLDRHNQCWEARGLYVTDGSSFPSQAYQNPTLTILALTERACRHALSGES